MTKCALCPVLLTDENASDEHVIPNAIGGWLKVQGFICRDCNSRTGRLWDAVAAQQLGWFTNFFSVQRDRDNTVPAPAIVQTANGQKLRMHVGGKLSLPEPTVKQVPQANGTTQLHIVARTPKEARQILTGLSAKYSSIDVEALMKDLSITTTYPGAVRIDPSFGGPMAGRSMVKSVLALAVAAGIAAEACDMALAYLLDEQGFPCFGYFDSDELVSGRPAGAPMHCVAVHANPDSSLCLGYAEYFGAFRMVVCLSDAYSGPDLSHAYAVDPRSGEAIPVTVKLEFSRQDLQSIYDYEKTSAEGMTAAFAAIMPAELERHFEAEKKQAMHEAVIFAMANCGAKLGDQLTEGQMRTVARLVSEKMMPFIQHHSGAGRPQGPRIPGEGRRG